MSVPRSNRFKSGVILVTLALCAFFLARGATAIVGAGILKKDVDAGAVRSRSRPPIARIQSRHDPAIILRRNIFNSELGDLTQALVVGPDGIVTDELVLADDEAVNRCAAQMRLTGTAVVPDDFERSLAVIVGSDRKATLYQGPAEVEGSRIRAIHSDDVLLQTSSGDVCRLAMFEVEGPPVRKTSMRSRAPVEEKKKKPRGKGPKLDRNAGLSDQELKEGIEKVSDTSFNIRRTLLNKVLDNAGRLIGIAAVSPKMEGDKSVGMEIRGVRKDTLLTMLGIQNKDVLESVNDEPLSSPDAALGAYTTLRTADKFTLSVQRDGRSMLITYNLN